MFGILTPEAFIHGPIETFAQVMVVGGALSALILITVTKRWKWLWKEWITSVDHKKIGVMYLVASALMLSKGLIDAVMIRGQQAFAVGDSMGYVTASHFQQLVTAHGVTMIFFVGMGVIFALINFILPAMNIMAITRTAKTKAESARNVLFVKSIPIKEICVLL